jgi:hypothetical protein
MENSLDEILGGEPLPEVVPEPVVEAVETQPETIERPRGPDGKFISKETGVEPQAPTEQVPPASQPSDQLPKDEYVALRAVRDENRDLKRQIEAIQQRLAQPQAQPQQPPVDFWDDPHGYMSQQFNQFGQTLLQQFEQRQRAERFDASEQAAKAKYADYSDAFGAFEQAVQANPQLAVQMAQSDNPGEFAYSRGKTALTLNQVGSLDAYESQLRAKWEAEVRASVPTPTLPPTTAADGSVGTRWPHPSAVGRPVLR